MGLLAGSCSYSYDNRGDTIDAIPCDEPAQYVNLGRPAVSAMPAEITVLNGRVWASLRHRIPAGGGLFEFDVETTRLYFGRTSEPPVRGELGSIDNALDGNGDDIGLQVRLHYQGFAEIPFPDADRYWLHSGGHDLELFTCEPDVISDAVGLPEGSGEWTGTEMIWRPLPVEITTRDKG